MYELHTFFSLNIAPSRIFLCTCIDTKVCTVMQINAAHKNWHTVFYCNNQGVFCSSYNLFWTVFTQVTSIHISFHGSIASWWAGERPRNQPTRSMFAIFLLFNISLLHVYNVAINWFPTSYSHVCKDLCILHFRIHVQHYSSVVTIMHYSHSKMMSSVDNYFKPLAMNFFSVCSCKHLWRYNYCYSSEDPPATPQLYE